MLEIIFEQAVPFSSLADCAPLMLKQTSLCSASTFSLLKHCKQLLFCEAKISQNLWCKQNMTCFHQLQATNPSSFQIFDLKCRLEKSA